MIPVLIKQESPWIVFWIKWSCEHTLLNLLNIKKYNFKNYFSTSFLVVLLKTIQIFLFVNNSIGLLIVSQSNFFLNLKNIN